MTASSKIPVLVARIVLGLIFFVFGLNFFLHFIPSGPMPEGKAGAFAGGLFQSGYLFQILKVTETVSGALILLGRYIPLVLIVLAPISLNIVLYHFILAPAPATITICILIIISQLYLAWFYRDSYKPLFVAKTQI
jgi:putative oxidoreductase